MQKSKKYKTWGKSRSIRLKHFNYGSSNRAYHVVIGSYKQQCLFEEYELNVAILDILKESALLSGYTLVAYCLMPDHLHILIRAGGRPKHLSEFIRRFKSYASKSAGRALWQRGYYEHILRKEEDLVKVAEYVVGNPVRKDIVSISSNYRWGGLFYDRASSQE